MIKVIILIVIMSIALFAENIINTKASDFFMQDKNSPIKTHIKLYDELRKGNGVVLAFFANWCLPCKKELPYLNSLAESFPNLSVIAISVDDTWDDKGKEAVKSLGFAQPVIHDKLKLISKRYNYNGTLPHTVYIRNDGTITDITNTFSEAKKDEVFKKVEAILN